MLRRTSRRPTIGHYASTGRVIVMAMLAQIGCGPAPSWAQDAPTSLSVGMERTFGPGWLQSIVVLPGGDLAVAGRRGLPPKGGLERHRKASVIRLDGKGDIVWETVIEDRRHNLFGGLSLTPDGKLVLLGVRGDGADWALTLDPGGKVTSEKSFGQPLAIIRHTVMLLDGSWASFGDDFTGGPPPRPTLFRFDPSGTFLGKGVLSIPAGGDLPTPLVTPVGSNGVAVVWETPAGSKARPRVMRFDGTTREPTWDVTIDLDPELEPDVTIAAPLTGGGLAIAGTVGAYGRTAPGWVAGVGADGRTQWLSRFSRFEIIVPFALTGLTDGAVVVGGCALATEAKRGMPWLAILDAKGNLAYEGVIPMQDGGTLLALAPLPNGAFAATGIGGNGCALIEAGIDGADTWVRVMRRPR
jgi:hypothetical protein